MKKRFSRFMTLTACCMTFPILFLSSCENLFNGAELKSKIENSVAYANSPSYTISVEQPKNRGIIKSPAGGTISKKVGDIFSINFEPLIDWEFVRWKIIDSATKTEIPNGEYLELTSIDESETECTLVNAPPESIKLCLSPVLSERPQIISYTPLYISGGTNKDTTIQVIFDYDMDAESIYYTTAERIEILKSGIPAGDFLSTNFEGDKKFYGYKKNGNYFFKNISISDNETGSNRNNCFSAPVFENPRRLSIPVRRDEESDDYTEIPDWSQLLVCLENSFFHKVEEKPVTMTSGKKWIYQVTDRTDSEPPIVFEPNTFTVKFADGQDLSPYDSQPDSDSIHDNTAMKLDINLKIKDIGIGPADSFTLNFKRVGSTNPQITKIVRFKSVQGDLATFSGKVSLSDTGLETGIYSMSFTFRDMSGNTLEYPSNGRYYFSVNLPFKFLMPIEDLFSIAGRGTVLTGKVKMGKINKYDAVQIVGFDKVLDTIIVQIEKDRIIVDSAENGDSVAILPRGISKTDVQRGMCICPPNTLQNHKKFEADIHLFTKAEGGRGVPVFTGYRPNFYFYTADVLGQMSFEEDMILPGKDATVTVELQYGMPTYVNQTFTIREGGKNVGEGTIRELLD